MESGVIVAWSGAIVDIPSGFALCDGGGGRPDLRNRFIVGAGDTYGVNDSGGTPAHEHTVIDGGHFHTLAAGVGIGAGGDSSTVTNSATIDATTGPAVHLPPYYALAFIIKL